MYGTAQDKDLKFLTCSFFLFYNKVPPNNLMFSLGWKAKLMPPEKFMPLTITKL